MGLAEFWVLGLVAEFLSGSQRCASAFLGSKRFSRSGEGFRVQDLGCRVPGCSLFGLGVHGGIWFGITVHKAYGLECLWQGIWGTVFRL